MAGYVKFERLLSPFHIRHLKLRNRMVKAPQSTMVVGTDCMVNERVRGLYESIAEGGVGMIVVGAMLWEPPPPGGCYLGLWDDKFIPGLKSFTEIIHKHNCPVFAQIHHTGPSMLQTLTGGPPIGPSSVQEGELPSPPPLLKSPRGLTVQEIGEIQERYLAAAVRAREAGFDGIEVHAGHGYLFASFLTRLWNRRDDVYGVQSFENRTRIVTEVIQKIKEKLGADYPLGVRINGEEWGSEKRLTIEESTEIARQLEKAGVDYISVTGYGYGPLPFRYVPDYWPYPEPEEYMKPYIQRFKGQGLLLPGAAAIKKAVSVPVIGVGRMTPRLAEEVLREGKVDLVALGRVLWADPDLPRKVASGRLEDIAPCTRCATCEDPPNGARKCRINAALGKEREYAIKPVEKKKKVMVVGGGPAGMEVARVAALRGHQVTLYEKGSRLGGLLPLAAMIKGLALEDLPSMIRYQETQLKKSGVDVKLGIEVDERTVLKMKPDAVVVATGGRSALPEIPGIGRPNVIQSSSLYRKSTLLLRVLGPAGLRLLTNIYLPIGKRVVILGGFIEGCQAAVFLVKRDRRVAIVESTEQIGRGVPERYHARLIPWLEKKGVKICAGAKCEEITEKGLVLTTKEGTKQTLEADSVMVMLPQEPNMDLFDALQGQGIEVYRVGACNGAESRLIVHAFDEARRMGCQL